MAQQTLNNAESGSVIRGKINDNFTECYAKQDALVSGTNIKTINSTSLLGSGDIAISGSVADGDKGDITVSASGATWTVDNSAISLAKMANVATATLLGRVTASTGVVEALTGTQATTLLDVFTTSLKGLVPAASGGSTSTQFLRKDGTWAVPADSGQASLNATYASGATDVLTFNSPNLSQSIIYEYNTGSPSGYKHTIINTFNGTAANQSFVVRLAGGWGSAFDALTLTGDKRVSFATGASLYISEMSVGSHQSIGQGILALNSATLTNTFLTMGYENGGYRHSLYGSLSGGVVASNFLTLQVYDTPNITLRDVLKLIANKAVEAYGPVRPGVYAYADVPTASSFTGHAITISDRSYKWAYSDGTDWRFFVDGAVIS